MHKKKLTIDEQINDLKSKNISFNLFNEEKAKRFLQYNNYYFKLKAYAQNYTKYSKVDMRDKYINLDFAYLVELSSLDMYFRRVIVGLCLDIEHVIKTRFMRDITNNQEEDGYSIVKEYVNQDYSVLSALYSNKDKSATKELIDKIKENEEEIPVWKLVEVLPFGRFVELYNLYYGKYGEPSYSSYLGTIKYFMMRSNPTKKDTDYDLIEDKYDSLPWNNDFQTKYLSGKLGYLEILDELGNKIADGGNQGWWYWSKEDINYYDWVLRDDYKIGKAGCGLIAASDFEVFFMSNYGYSPSNGANNPLTSGKIKKNDYMNYVNDNFRYTYDLSNLYPDYKINITTLEIVSGLQQFLKQNNSQISTIKWAPLINGRGDDNYFLLIDTIEGMIENNIPVVASIHSTFNPIVFYTSSDKARNRNVLY